MNRAPWPNLIWQPLIAIVFVFIVLFFMQHFSNSDLLWAVGAGSLSSSSYIIFGKPSAAAAQSKKIIGGYLVGILTGLLLRFILMSVQSDESFVLEASSFQIVSVLAAISVGLSFFFMVLFKLEHPPAAGMALVLVIDMREYTEILLVFVAAIILAVIRRLLCRQLVDLT